MKTQNHLVSPEGLRPHVGSIAASAADVVPVSPSPAAPTQAVHTTKGVSYFYATSSNATEFKLRDGGYVVFVTTIKDGKSTCKDVAGFAAKEEAMAHADTLEMPWASYMGIDTAPAAPCPSASHELDSRPVEIRHEHGMIRIWEHRLGKFRWATPNGSEGEADSFSSAEDAATQAEDSFETSCFPASHLPLVPPVGVSPYRGMSQLALDAHAGEPTVLEELAKQNS